MSPGVQLQHAIGQYNTWSGRIFFRSLSVRMEAKVFSPGIGLNAAGAAG
jgi:hypothetical protein